MPKITALPSMTTADAADVAPIVDDSAGSTKKITLTKMKEWLQSLTSWITTAMLSNASVTADKLATGASESVVATSQTTTSGSYTDLATSGPAVTVTVGANGMALVFLNAYTLNATQFATNYISVAVSGATTLAASDTYGCLRRLPDANGTGTGIGAALLITGLTPGSNTFTAKYKVNTSTGTFVARRIAVVPL